MSVAEKLKLSAENYLDGELRAEVKHEYIDGEVWAMAGAGDAHVTIALNLAALLKQALKNTPCRTYISDMKVRVEAANAFFYPDVFVSCETRDRDNNYFKQHPLFIAEVLSPSTEAFDRGEKFRYYRQLDSLQYYWLVDSDKTHVDCFTRTADNNWLLHSVDGQDAVIALDALNINAGLSELYEAVIFEA
jgi:Uma2 family endonuclease